MDTKKIGDISELTAMLYFKKAGIPVLIPYGDNEPYDFVIDINYIFYRVQVKTGAFKNGCLELRGRKCTYDRVNGRGRKTSNYIGKTDIFALHYDTNIWLIPIDDVGESGTMMLRINNPKDSINKKNIKWARDYEFDIQLEKLLKGS